MEKILGQDRALDQLRAQLRSGRVHHAQIFHGPAGVGKFTTALALARVILCHSPQLTLEGLPAACGQCVSCLAFRPDQASENPDALAHPDLHIINKELARYSDDKQIRDRKLLSIPVDVLREALIGPAYRGAQLNHGKVFIVDEAELLNDQGQNALLKTLEEPPAAAGSVGTFIILVTAQEDRLIPTIRSRCQRTAFVSLPDAVLERFLNEHAHQLDPIEVSWLVGFAQGSLGRAQLALDFGLTEWARVVLAHVEQMARGRAVPTLGGEMAERINAMAEQWVKRYANASKEAANKLAAGLMFSLVSTHCQQQLRAVADRCDPADPEAAESMLAPWLRVIEVLREAEWRLARNVNLNLACDGLASQLALTLGRGAAA